MHLRLDPTVLDTAKERTGAGSDEVLGVKHLGCSGNTVRSYRKGLTVPSVYILARLREITGRPFDTMLVPAEALPAA